MEELMPYLKLSLRLAFIGCLLNTMTYASFNTNDIVDIAKLNIFLKKDPGIANATFTDKTGKEHPLLLWAIANNKPKHAQLLLDAGANPNAKDGHGQHIAIQALQQDDPVFLKMLLDKDPKVANATHSSSTTGKVYSLLEWARMRSKFKHVQLLSAFQARSNTTNHDKMLQIAFTVLQQNNQTLFKKFINKDSTMANVIFADCSEQPLSLKNLYHASSLPGAEAKANIDKLKEDLSMAFRALQEDNSAFLNMLLHKTPVILNVTIVKSKDNMQPLHQWAAANNKPKCASLLLATKTKLNTQKNKDVQSKKQEEAHLIQPQKQRSVQENTAHKQSKKKPSKPKPTEYIDPAQDEQRKEKIAEQEKLEQLARIEREATEKTERLARHEKNKANKAQKPSTSASTATAAAPPAEHTTESTQKQAPYAGYTIEYLKEAKAQKESIDKEIIDTIVEKINGLKNGEKTDLKKIRETGDWRLKPNRDYRVILTFNDDDKTILIKDIQPRKDAYK